jgi:hypothetical protein
MLSQSAGVIFEKSNGNSKIKAIAKAIWSYPIKIIASFFAAPFLIFRIAKIAKNPMRRWIAIIGLLLSLLASYAAATFLGTLVGAALIATNISVLAGIGFLFGTTLSIYLSVIFSIITFNTVSFFFLKASSEEVVAYLKEVSK